MNGFSEAADMVRSIFMVFIYLGVGIFLCMASSINIEVTFPGGKWNYVVGVLAILYSFLRIYQLYIKFKFSSRK
ncbi:MAG: hypothetical protein ACRC0A_03050 [Chitinophagaceae bacterium]